MPTEEDFSKKMWQTPLSRQVIYFFAAEGKPNEQQLADAFDGAGIPPNRHTAQEWLLRLLGGLGLALLLSGVMFFFAYNWDDIHKFAKIGLVATALIGVGIFTLTQAAGSFPYQMGLTALTVLTGIQLALLGQIYQSGANAYDFFLAWSMLTIFWVASSQFPPLWFFYAVLLNTTIALYAVQIQLIHSEGKLMLVLAIINGVITALWEWHHLNREQAIFRSRWFPRIMALATCICIGIPAMISLYEHTTFRTIALLVFIVLNVVIFWFYQQQLKEAFMLALPILGGIILVNNIIGRFVFKDFDSGQAIFVFFCWSIVNIIITIFVIRYLTKINKQWKMQEIEGK